CVGDGLQHTEHADAVRAVAGLDAPNNFAFAEDAHVELRRQHEDQKAGDEPDERGEDVNDAVREDVARPFEDDAGDVREVSEVVPVVGGEKEGHQRSISPTTMSTEPSTTMASATVPPTVISFNAVRLMNDGGRMWNR